MQNLLEGSIGVAATKISASAVVAAALCLWVWQLVGELPTALGGVVFGRVVAIANVALIIHAIEAAIAAMLTFQGVRSPRVQKTIKVSLYVFFVGTVGLSEIVRASKDNAIDSFLE
jgi:hypothetical protein